MKVALLNGSPHKNGCTHRALAEVADKLEQCGIETEMLWIGTDAIRGCIACGACGRNGNHRCAFDDDVTNSLIEKMEVSDGIVLGSPVYYAGANGALTAVLDRIFYAASATLAHKPGAAIASARRAGTTPTLERLNKYFTINCMPVVSSTYWPMVHGAGNTEQDVEKDEEGLQVMRNLGANMAWMLKCIEAGKAAGVDIPAMENGARTNFIR